MTIEDKKILELIRGILNKGNDVEIRKNRDGSLKVFELKRHICR
ncbi:MAG: hypothetical protein PUC17_08090 [Anaerostipes sp.]|nr:hypothetical protein [Anaerostipes sp. 992a]MDD5969414.1 hypothetical protein [Anaerostipes sp.]